MNSHHNLATLYGWGATAIGTAIGPAVAIVANVPPPAPPISPETVLTTIIASIFTGISGLVILFLNSRDKRIESERRIEEARIESLRRVAEAKITADAILEQRRIESDERFDKLEKENALLRTNALIELALRKAEAERLPVAKAEADRVIDGLRSDVGANKARLDVVVVAPALLPQS